VLFRSLNRTAGDKALPVPGLLALAAGIGADVPFLLFARLGLGRSARGRGIGEVLEPARVDLAGFGLLVACPPVSVSTSRAYAAWDELAEPQAPPDAARDFLTAATRMDKEPLCFRACLWNSFEQAVFPLHPRLPLLKEELLGQGAAGAVMSGSGASILALFRDPAAGARAAEALRGVSVPAFARSLD